jgi:Arm DNA-binding domain
MDVFRVLCNLASQRIATPFLFMWPPSGPEICRRAVTENLSPTLIAGLKPAVAGNRYQIMDAQVPGFNVRGTDKGYKTYILRCRFPGGASPSRREIGNCADLTLADARDKAREWRSIVARGLDPAVEEERTRQEALRKLATTFSVVVDDFIHQKLAHERKGKDAEREIRRDLMPDWKDRSITSIRDVDVVAVIKRKIPDGKVGARNLLALIKRFFE